MDHLHKCRSASDAGATIEGLALSLDDAKGQFRDSFDRMISALPRRDPDSTERMIPPEFLDRESRQDLIELARNGSAAQSRNPL
jgi:hypothetical protein